MRFRPALFALALAAIPACWLAMRAQSLPPSAADSPPDPAQLSDAAAQVAARAEHLKAPFAQVRVADWAAQGAPEAYVAQWNSLVTQNDAIETEMGSIAQRPEAMGDLMKAIFRVERFDRDFGSLIGGIRKYQNPALADLIESVAADQSGVEKLEQYMLSLTGEKEQQLDVVDREAQRCRAALANTPNSKTKAK